MREFVNEHHTVLQVLAMGMGAFSIIFGRQLLGHFKQLAPLYRLLLAVIPTATYTGLLASIMDTVSDHFFSQVAGQAFQVHLTPLAFAAGVAALYVVAYVVYVSTSGGDTGPHSWSGWGATLFMWGAVFVLYVGFVNYYIFSVLRWLGGHPLPLPVVLAIGLAVAALTLVAMWIQDIAKASRKSTSEPSSESKPDGARFWLLTAVAYALLLPMLALFGLATGAIVAVVHQIGWASVVFYVGLGVGTGIIEIVPAIADRLEVDTLSWIFGVPGALAALLGIILTNVNVLPQ